MTENQEPDFPETPIEGSRPTAGDEFCDTIQTRLDERGRIKLPTEVREFLERKYGKGYNTFYITSLDGETAEIYPLCEWSKRWRKILALPQSLPLRTTMVRTYSRFGRQASMDPQGRMPIREELRAEANLAGEVTVMWEGNLLRAITMTKLRETPRPTPQQLDEAKNYDL